MLSEIITAVEFAAKLAAVGVQVAPYLTKVASAFGSDAGPTQAERDELTAMEDDLDAQLQAAQPAPQ